MSIVERDGYFRVCPNVAFALFMTPSFSDAGFLFLCTLISCIGFFDGRIFVRQLSCSAKVVRFQRPTRPSHEIHENKTKTRKKESRNSKPSGLCELPLESGGILRFHEKSHRRGLQFVRDHRLCKDLCHLRRVGNTRKPQILPASIRITDILQKTRSDPFSVGRLDSDRPLRILRSCRKKSLLTC